MSSQRLKSLAWPGERLGEALEALARAGGMVTGGSTVPTPPAAVAAGEIAETTRWLIAAAPLLGSEVEALTSPYPEFEEMIIRTGPMMMRFGPGRFLLVLGQRGRRTVEILAPDNKRHRFKVDKVRAALCSELEGRVRAGIEKLLSNASIPPRRWQRTGDAMVREMLGGQIIGPCWIVRLPPGAPFWRQLRQAALVTRLVALGLFHIANYLLMLAGWWLIGRGVLSGDFNTAWMLGWGLMLLSLVPLRVVMTWLNGRFMIGAGALIRQRLLAGLQNLDPESTCHQGAGQLLGKVLESSAVEGLVLNGAHQSLLAAVDVVMTAMVLAAGAGGLGHAGLFLGMVGLALTLTWRLYLARDNWTGARLDLTHDLVERIVGHRTRLAQQPPAQWHELEDELLDHFTATAQRLDRIDPLVENVPFLWHLVGVAGLAAAFIGGEATTAGLAIALGGVILGSRALKRFASGAISVTGALVAWKRVAAIYRAASVPAVTTIPDFGVTGQGAESETLIAARDLSYRFADRQRPALDGVNLTIRRGDRLLLVGPSGGGKSTLASLISAIRTPQSGLLLLNGLDLATVGDQGWRQRVAAAPQFHENHVLTETFAFNLLMGRGWPPGPGDIEAAEAICAELGLGE